MADDREEIARIIDPKAWETLDHLASLPNPYLDAAQRYVAESLAKADAILSRRPEGVAEPVAWRYRLAIGGWKMVDKDPSSWTSTGEALYAHPPVQDGLLDWLATEPGLELTCGEDDEIEGERAWFVYRVNGGVNDREWTRIAKGPTPAAALLAARPKEAGR